jgi:hypothetical protein
MTFDHAVTIINAASEGQKGLVVELRNGRGPDKCYTEELLSSLRTVFDELRGKQTIDRSLSSSLFGLAYYVREYASSQRHKGRFRREFVDYEQFQISYSIESIFADVWVTPED